MADEQIVTSIVAKADLSSLVSQVHRATASLQQMQRELLTANKSIAAAGKVANNLFKDTLVSSGMYSSHFVNLTSDVEKFGRQLDSGRLKLRDYFQTFRTHATTQKGLIRELAQEQVMLQNAIFQPLGRNAQGIMQFNALVPRGLDAVRSKTQLANMQMQIMNRALSEGATSLINWGKNTQWAGRQLTVGLTVPLTMFGTAAAKAFREADQELVRLQKVYGGLSATSATELAKVRKDVTDTAKTLSSSYGATFKETLSLAADIAATGKQGNELLGSIKETTRLSILGEVDRQEAMKATLAIQTAFKQNTEELSQSINFLNAVENQTSTTLSDLVEAIPKAGPVIKGLGGSVKDLALYLTAMREGGISASEGANALKSGLASLINPTKVAQAKFKDFGIDLMSIVNNNAGNVTQTLLDLQSALDKLDPLSKQQAIEQLFGKFQFSRMNALFENLGKSGSQTLEVLKLMKASASDLEGIATRELKMVTESSSGRYRRALETLKADLATTGERFLDVGTKFINIFDKVLKFFEKLPDPIKKAVTYLGGFAAVVGPLIMLTGLLANFFGYITKGVVTMRAFFTGQKSWKMLTPEILATEKASRLVEKGFYSDAQAAEVLHAALTKLINDYANLTAASTKSQIPINPVVSTATAGNIIMAGAARREVDPASAYAGQLNTRAIAHMRPRDINNPATLMGGVPFSIPANQKIRANPQIYMHERLPNVEGLTSFGGVSSGVVAGEAARFHALMATLGMQTEAEVAALKKTISLGGTVSNDLLQTFDDILPLTTKIADNAATASAGIVAELRAGKITLAQARSQIMALNAQIEQELITATSSFASARGRTIDFTKAPLMNQPVTDRNAQFTLRDLYKKEGNRAVMEEFGRLRGVRTFGAPYSIEATRIPKLNSGGDVEGFGPNKTVVSGPTSINYDDRLGSVPLGGYVLNQSASMNPENQDLIALAPYTYSGGGEITAALTPGEVVFGPKIHRIPGMYDLLEAANNGYSLGGNIVNNIGNYGDLAVVSSDRIGQLYDYLDHLTDDAYPERFKQNAILNDATALLDSGKTKNVETALRIAESDVSKALAVAGGDEQEYYRIRDLQARARRLNTGSIGTRQTTKSINRELVAKLMKDRGYNLIKEAADRAHLFSRFYSETNKGYYGQAIHDPWNKYSNWLSDRLGIEDRVPVTDQSRYARADLIAKQFGFEDHNHMLMNRSIFEKSIVSGRAMPGMARTMSLLRFLKRNNGGLIPGGMVIPLRRNYGNLPSLLTPEKMLRVLATSKELSSKNALGQFANTPNAKYSHQIAPSSGKSYPIPGVSGVYKNENGDLVFFKGVPNEISAKAEMYGTRMAREVFGLDSPNQTARTVANPFDPSGKSKLLGLESPFDPKFAAGGTKFTEDQMIRQTIASLLMGNKDLSKSNVFGNVLADVGPAGVFPRASMNTAYAESMNSMEKQAMINLLAVRGGARKDFAYNTSSIAAGMSPRQYGSKMKAALRKMHPKMQAFIESLPKEDRAPYIAMLRRLEEGMNVNWSKYQPIHSNPAFNRGGGIVSSGRSGYGRRPAGFRRGEMGTGRQARREGTFASYNPGNVMVDSMLAPIENALFMYTGHLQALSINTAKSIKNSSIMLAAAAKTSGSYISGAYQDAGRSMRNSARVASANAKLYAHSLALAGAVKVDQFGQGVRYHQLQTFKNAGYNSPSMVPLSAVPLMGPGLVGNWNQGGVYNNQGQALEGISTRKVGTLGMRKREFMIGDQILTAKQAKELGLNYRGAGMGMGAQMGLAMGGQMLGGTLTQKGQSGLGTAVMAASTAAMFLPMHKAGAGLKYLGGGLKDIIKGMTSFTKIAARGLNLIKGFGLVGGLVMLGTAIYKVKKHMDDLHQKTQLTFGMTKKGAEQAGIKYFDLAERMKLVAERQKAMQAANMGAYKSGSVPGLQMSIEDLSKAKENAKKNLGEFVESFNVSSNFEQTLALAKNLKAQFIAAGMGAKEASTKIYGIIAASNKANDAFKVFADQGFAQITDQTSAATYAVQNFVYLMSGKFKGDMNAAATEGVKTLINSFESLQKSLVGTKNSMGEVITEGEAFKMAMEKMSQTSGFNTQIGADVFSNMPVELQAITNQSDTIAGILAKWKLYSSDVVYNFKDMSSAAAVALAQFNEAFQSGIDQMEAGTASGSYADTTFKRVGDRLKSLKKIIDANSLSNQRAAAKAQRSAEDEIKLINKKIQAIEDEKNAKLAALDAVRKKEDYQIQIQKAQLDYQDAIARGDMAAAARAQLTIKEIEGQRQNELAQAAIEEEAKKQQDALRKQAEKIQEQQDALNRRQTIASEKSADAQAAAGLISGFETRYQQLLGTRNQIQFITDKDQRSRMQQQSDADLIALFKEIQAEGTKKGTIAEEIKKAFQGLAFDEKGNPLKLSTTSYQGSTLTTNPNLSMLNQIGADMKAANAQADRIVMGITGGLTLKDLAIAMGLKVNTPSNDPVPGDPTNANRNKTPAVVVNAPKGGTVVTEYSGGQLVKYIYDNQGNKHLLSSKAGQAVAKALGVDPNTGQPLKKDNYGAVTSGRKYLVSNMMKAEVYQPHVPGIGGILFEPKYPGTMKPYYGDNIGKGQSSTQVQLVQNNQLKIDKANIDAKELERILDKWSQANANKAATTIASIGQGRSF